LASSLVLILLSWTAPSASAQETHVAVIVGLAGEPEHAELFQRWGATLVDGAAKLGIDPARIIYLSDKPDGDPKRITGRSTKAAVESAFGTLAGRAGPDDVVFVMLIGHGTFDGKVAKFNLPGPDMTPADFDPLLKTLKAKQVVFVNAASASGPFLAGLAGPGRTVVTATRSGAEKFSTLFGGHFVDALTSEAADADKNRRISVLEAFNAAKLEVGRAYEREGIMLTEHPLLDDSGKGEGTGEPRADGAIGRVASIITLGSTAAAEPLPEDPQLRALYQQRRDLETRVETLRLLKNGMEPAKYAADLEKILTDLALTSRQIKELEGKR
jgi:hypothetical protein